MPPAPPGSEPISVIPREAAEARIDEQRRALVREISVLTDRVQSLEQELSNAREQRADLQVELTSAREQLGELRGRLDVVQSERLPARG